jgi:SAM-dependent methyltransferase
MERLDLGCGGNKTPGAVGLDKYPGPGVDLVHDLDQLPLPFENGRFDWIEMSHVIEHVSRPKDLMDEVHRIAKPGATVRVITPHYSSQLSYGDLDHFHHFGYITFTELQNSGKFRLKKHKIHFTDFYKVFGISLLAHVAPRRWEKYLAFIFPAMYVDVLLEVKK